MGATFYGIGGALKIEKCIIGMYAMSMCLREKHGIF